MIHIASILLFLAGFAGLHLLGVVSPWAYYCGGIMAGMVFGGVVVVYVVGQAEVRGNKKPSLER